MHSSNNFSLLLTESRHDNRHKKIENIAVVARNFSLKNMPKTIKAVLEGRNGNSIRFVSQFIKYFSFF